jgi:hypothetical protein
MLLSKGFTIKDVAQMVASTEGEDARVIEDKEL